MICFAFVFPFFFFPWLSPTPGAVLSSAPNIINIIKREIEETERGREYGLEYGAPATQATNDIIFKFFEKEREKGFDKGALAPVMAPVMAPVIAPPNIIDNYFKRGEEVIGFEYDATAAPISTGIGYDNGIINIYVQYVCGLLIMDGIYCNVRYLFVPPGGGHVATVYGLIGGVIGGLFEAPSGAFFATNISNILYKIILGN